MQQAEMILIFDATGKTEMLPCTSLLIPSLGGWITGNFIPQKAFAITSQDLGWCSFFAALPNACWDCCYGLLEAWYDSPFSMPETQASLCPAKLGLGTQTERRRKEGLYLNSRQTPGISRQIEAISDTACQTLYTYFITYRNINSFP